MARETTPPGANVPWVQVQGVHDLPAALARLARQVALADHLQPKAVARLATDHARTLLTLADILAQRDTVPGATTPALLGVPSELRALAAALTALPPAVLPMRSGIADDRRPGWQMREIRRFMRHERRRIQARCTDSHLHVAVAALRPALRLPPALHRVVHRHVRNGLWQAPLVQPADVEAQGVSGRSAMEAVRRASDISLRIAGWLPPAPVVSGYRHSHITRSELETHAHRPSYSDRGITA